MKQNKSGCFRSRKYFVLSSLVVLLGLVCGYFGPGFPSVEDHGSGDDGTDPVFGGFHLRDDDFDELFEDQEHNSDVPKSIPVCDMQYSELIPCLDRNFIYQMKLKLNLTLMEHYERHCPPPHRRFNCLISPPIGYKVPIR